MPHPGQQGTSCPPEPESLPTSVGSQQEGSLFAQTSFHKKQKHKQELVYSLIPGKGASTTYFTAAMKVQLSPLWNKEDSSDFLGFS